MEKEKFDASLRLREIACNVQAGTALVGTLQEALEGSHNAALNYSDAAYAIALYLGRVSDTLLALAEGGAA